MNILMQAQVVTQAASSQKFDVVVGVIAIIFLGIVAYLISMDRKLTKLEKK
jgi:CcmD family protein